MRLFIAVEIGPDVRRAASNVIEELKHRAARLAPRARVSWLKPERLHVTVRFIGDADDSLFGRVRAALEPPLSTAAFDLTVAGTGSFPPRRPPRVLWAGLTVGLEHLRAVEQEVRSRLESRPGPFEDDDYNPHLTLARVKHPAGLRPSALLEGLENVAFGTLRVEAVTLFESRLSSPEPSYVVLGRTSLRRTQP